LFGQRDDSISWPLQFFFGSMFCWRDLTEGLRLLASEHFREWLRNWFGSRFIFACTFGSDLLFILIVKAIVCFTCFLISEVLF
jgi:hypothetical protein